jgi:hypothetical protein
LGVTSPDQIQLVTGDKNSEAFAVKVSQILQKN